MRGAACERCRKPTTAATSGEIGSAGRTADSTKLFQDEAKARFDAAVGADIGFVERLVWFWSNHFCISA